MVFLCVRATYVSDQINKGAFGAKKKKGENRQPPGSIDACI